MAAPDTLIDGAETELDRFDDVTPISHFQLLDAGDTPIVLGNPKLPPPLAELDDCSDSSDSGPIISSAPAPGDEYDILSASESHGVAEQPPFRDRELGHAVLPPAAPASPTPLDVAKPWASATKNRRPLPRPAQLALLGAGSLVVLVLLSGRCGSTTGAAAVSSTVVIDDLVVSEETLRKRTEITRDDFAVGADSREAALTRLREQEKAAQAAAAAAASSSTSADSELEERRKRRAQNPEDVRSAAGRKAAAAPAKPAEPVVYLPIIHDPGDALPAKSGKQNDSHSTPSILVSAGDTVPARLTRAVIIRSGSETVVARVSGQGLPEGTKAIGRARLRDDQASVRFSKLVLPSGIEVRCEAEAQDLDGNLETDGPDDGSIAGDVASGTGDRLIDGLTGGLVSGGLADARDSSRRRSQRTSRRQSTLTLSKGERFKIFFLSAATLRN